MKARIAPFLDLLDARYLPLLCVVSPQAYTVFAWLLASHNPAWVAVLGGVGYEFVYVGAVAWAAYGAGWSAARMPAITALVFSVAVAVAHYAPTQGALAILHAGFPLTAYAFTRMMHAPTAPARSDDAERPAPIRALSAHACRKCGASVDTQQQSAASARWGCAACRVKKVA